MDCRLIWHEPADGAWNMGVDEAMLEAAGRVEQGACLRFYQWDQPTLSLGYFQRQADRQTHEPSRGCPIVRRSTGGGAILHDRELTYSFTTTISDRMRSDLRRFYDIFHGTLIGLLNDLGVRAGLCPGLPPNAKRDEPFLCFQRRVAGDVLVGSAKIGGSAQRRHHAALLQHGSVLLRRSEAAPELPGIGDLTGVQISPWDLAYRWAERIASEIGMPLKRAELTADESGTAQRLTRERFADPWWTCRR
jgi:lipoate-protein ligase A